MTAAVDKSSPLGRAIRSERARQHLTRRTLAARADVTEANLARIELYGQEPTLSTLSALAAALSVPVASLMDEQAAS